MNKRLTGLPRRESGAVLVVSLIMLAVLTLFVISMIKTSVIELKIGGSSQTAAINRASAESALENFMALNSGRFAPGWLAQSGTAGPVSGSLAYTSTSNAYGALGSAVTITAVQVSCGAWSQIGTMIGSQSLQSVQFDVAAAAAGPLGIGGTAVVHQGVQSAAPAGSC
jgi:Tfp pilus assembly protein PilX